MATHGSQNRYVNRVYRNQRGDGGFMLRPKILLVPAILFAIPPAVCLTMRPSLAESTADACRTKPGSAGPAGSHWYYRINGTDGRRCWFLGKAGIDEMKVHSVAREESHRPARNPKAQHSLTETALPSPAQATPAQVAPAPVAPMSVTPAPMALGASTAFWSDEKSRLTDFAVSWPSMQLPAALDARESGTMRGDGPTRSVSSAGVQLAKIQEPPSEAAFSPTMFTGVLAVALMLSGTILQLARRLRKEDGSDTAAGWLDAYHQLLDGAADTGRKSAAGNRPDGVGLSAKTTNPGDLGAGLQQLVRDLRGAEAETGPRRRFESDGRHRLRLLAGKAAAQRSARPAPARKTG